LHTNQYSKGFGDILEDFEIWLELMSGKYFRMSGGFLGKFWGKQTITFDLKWQKSILHIIKKAY
jgi:hypothetical protein